jgi:hypothetical protein
MAKDKPDLNREYVDVTAEDFSEAVQALLDEERAIYQLLKEAKAKTVAAAKAEVPMPLGREIASMAYTRWGQLQMIVQDKAAPKATQARNQTLAQFLAQQAASGLRT